MTNTLRICITGGTGFVGRHLSARLAAAGHTLLLPTRHPDSARALNVLPSVRLLAADIHDRGTLDRLFTGCDAVINLVGILNERRRGDFHRAHVELTAGIVAAAEAAGVRRLLQMSSLRADADDAPSNYLRSKGEAERAVAAATALDWTIFQPSVIFGRDDSFINRFADLMRLSPLLPLARPNARFAPVWVEDVAKAMKHSLTAPATHGQTLQLCGPQVYSLRELVNYIRAATGAAGITLNLPDGLARLQARALQLLPGKPFTMDNYRSMTVHSICERNGFEVLGLKPRSLEGVAPSFLGDGGRNSRFSRLRRSAGR
ncbi:MAG: complex I NDUFA9 subunit family protein [Pseudomonadota bacterium]